MIPTRHPLRAAALVLALACGVSAMPGPAHAAAPMARTQAPGFYRVMLGDFEVTALNDGVLDLPADKLLQQPAAKTAAALGRGFLGLPVETSVNAYLVNTGTKLVLIDAGAGTLFGPTVGRLVANLQAAGYQPGQVDDILITHMHADHVGGLAADGKLAFPNATVHADKRDADFWLSPATLQNAPADSRDFVEKAQRSLQPYVAAGRFQAFEGSGEIVPGVSALSSYGHTAGHTSYVVESRGRRLVVVGDLIHVGAVQFDDPKVTIAFDMDAKTAAAARARVFGQAAKEGDLVGAAHLSFPGLGHLRAAGKAWQWIPVNYAADVK